jgi:hypothetical protein
MNEFCTVTAFQLTGSIMGTGKDSKTWEAASGALGVQAADCAPNEAFSSMHQSFEFRIVYKQHFNDSCVIFGIL